MTLYTHADDLETVYEYMREVLSQLTDALLELFTPSRVQITIESTYLNDVMQELRDLDDASVEECIPDGWVPKTLKLVETLATAGADYYVNNQAVDDIKHSARALKTSISRVKGKLGAT